METKKKKRSIIVILDFFPFVLGIWSTVGKFIREFYYYSVLSVIWEQTVIFFSLFEGKKKFLRKVKVLYQFYFSSQKTNNPNAGILNN